MELLAVGLSHRSAPVALLERVGMATQADQPCATLAYGDAKRMELALALANAPRLLLMDEPTAGTSPRSRGRLMQLAVSVARDSGDRIGTSKKIGCPFLTRLPGPGTLPPLGAWSVPIIGAETMVNWPGGTMISPP